MKYDREKVNHFLQIGMFLFTVAGVLLMFWQIRQAKQEHAAIASPTNLAASESSPPGNTQERPGEQPLVAKVKEEILVWAPPLVLTVAIVFSSWLNLRASRLTAAPHPRGNQGDSLPAASQPAREVRLGSSIRVKAKISENERRLSPGWTPEMDRYLGCDYVVEGIYPNGCLKLKGVTHLFRKEWIELPSNDRPLTPALGRVSRS